MGTNYGILKNGIPSERIRGMRFLEVFNTESDMEANGGTVVGSVASFQSVVAVKSVVAVLNAVQGTAQTVKLNASQTITIPAGNKLGTYSNTTAFDADDIQVDDWNNFSSLRMFTTELSSAETEAYEDDTMFDYVGTAVTNLPFGPNEEDIDNVQTNDVSPHNNNAILGDGSTPSTFPTLIDEAGKGYDFDGANTYMESTDTVSLPSVTICSFVKFDSASLNTIVATGDTGDLYILGVGVESGVGTDTYINFAMFDGSWKVANTSLAPILGRYYHICGVVRGSTLELWVDGVFIDSLAVTPDSREFKVAIGRRNNPPHNYFDGHIYDVKVYDTALSPLQIMNSYIAISASVNRVVAPVFEGVPYEDDLLGNWFGDYSTWNDEGPSDYVLGSANIPDKLNGIDTDGEESVVADVPVAYFQTGGYVQFPEVNENPTAGVSRFNCDFMLKSRTTSDTIVFADSNYIAGYYVARVALGATVDQLNAAMFGRTYGWYNVPALVVGHRYRLSIYKSYSWGSHTPTAYLYDMTDDTAIISWAHADAGTATTSMQIRLDKFGSNDGISANAKYIIYKADVYINNAYVLRTIFDSNPPVDTTGNRTLTNHGADFTTYTQESTTSTPAIVSQRLVAESASGDYVSIPSLTMDVTKSHLYEWKCCVNSIAYPLNSTVSSSYIYFSTTRLGISFDGILVSFASIVAVAGKCYDCSLSYTGEKTGTGNFTGTVTDEDGTVQTETVTVDVSASATFNINRLCTFEENFDIKVTQDSVLLGKWTLEGHVYDTSGSGNHGTNNGVDLTSVVNDFANGLYSGLLREGFDLYLLNGATEPYSATDWHYVPHVNGTPVVSSVSGYTKQTPDRNALVKGLNNAPAVKITFTADVTGNPFDRSGTRWNALAQGGAYDPTNKTTWLLSELTPYNFNAWSESSAKQMLYIASDPSGYRHINNRVQTDAEGYAVPYEVTALKSCSLLVYATRKTPYRDVRLVEYLDASDYTEKT